MSPRRVAWASLAALWMGAAALSCSGKIWEAPEASTGEEDAEAPVTVTPDASVPRIDARPPPVDATPRPRPDATTTDARTTDATTTVDAPPDVTVEAAGPSYAVGGSVQGLEGTGLVLENNGGDDVSVSVGDAGAPTSFTFPTKLAMGAAFSVTVKTQPTGPSQTCTVTSGMGTVGGGPVDGITVACTTNQYTVGGTVMGLGGAGLILQDNGRDDLAVSGNGTFAFATHVASGQPYAVTVLANPTGPAQTCTVSPGTASGTVLGTDISTVAVTCTANTYSVGGAVVGLSGSGLVLQDNGSDNLSISGNGAFLFAQSVASGAAFDVTIATQPTNPAQTCSVSGGSGTVAAGAVMGVVVNCSANTFVVGGTVTGLSGSGLQLSNNGGPPLPINANGTFAFATPVASGTAYSVVVVASPSGPTQTCAVTGGSGTVGSANVTGVTVQCSTNLYTVGGTVTGLAGSGLILHNDRDDISVAANGPFTFPTPVASGATYSVAVATEPSQPTQTCTVSGGASGFVGSANVTGVTVTCKTNSYTVGGTVSGLQGTGLVLQNGSDVLPVAANTTFVFPTRVASGATYTVSVMTEPGGPTQTCNIVAGATGTVTNANVTNVVVDCSTNSYTVGGTVSGLQGTGLQLQDNNDVLPIAGAGPFTFPTAFTSGAMYTVTVKTSPSGPTQMCSVNAAGTGTVTNANVTGVVVTCSTSAFSVGGTLSGLTGTGLQLQNGSDVLPVAPNSSSFTFPTAVASGATYTVSVAAQPDSPSQNCTVSAGSGMVTSGPVTSVVVTCTTDQFSVGGTVSGLTGTGLVLQNGADVLPVPAGASSFTFPTSVASGASYSASVTGQPSNPTQTCSITAGAMGTVTSGPVTGVTVACTTNTYNVMASVSGTSSAGLVLQDNGGDNLSISGDGTWTFATQVASGQPYAVSVLASPTGQNCMVPQPSGTVTNAAVTVTVTCSAIMCPSGQTLCGSSCFDLQSDPNNCGGCTTSQANFQCLPDGSTSWQCSNGVCCPGTTGCPNPSQNNQVTCTDTTTDLNNCGGCGKACDTTTFTNCCPTANCSGQSCGTCCATPCNPSGGCM